MRSSLNILAILFSAALAALSCSAFQAVITPSAKSLQQQVQQRNTNYVPSFWMSEDSSAAEEPTTDAEEAVDPKIVCPNCDMCDGSGRIAGGIGAVLPWIPIKAYRPCPNFVERGGNYQRAGQGLDEIAFGKKNK